MLEPKQDTKWLLNPKERQLLYNRLVNKVWLVSGAESMITILELFGGY